MDWIDGVDVLDKGSVVLVDKMGNDLSIVRSARVSYNADWRAGEDEGSDTKLIKYLINNHHNTPFESVTFTFMIKAPIFVVRQWHRHRTQSYNEQSARYTVLEDDFYIPSPENIGRQSKINKQGRDTDGFEMHEAQETAEFIEMHSNGAYNAYEKMLDVGIAREIARMVLPFNIYTRMFTTMNLHNLFGFLGERMHHHAQWEIQQYANAMYKLIQPIVPVAVEAWSKKNADTIRIPD